jgi:ABC-type polysaccharide/polyol phosphate export permease
LQSVLVGPGSRASIVLGKALGVASVGLVQASLFLVFLPWSGIDIGGIDWLSLAGILVVSAVSLAAFGFALAWWINSSTGYHAIMSILLLPAWVLSGAMFPIPADGGVLSSIIRYNPMSYMVNGVRQAVYETVPAGSTMGEAAWVDWAVVLGFAAFSLAWATRVCYARR